MYIPLIETPRLLLRPMTEADAPAVFVWCSDPVVNRFMTYPLYTQVEDARAWLCHMATEEAVLLCGIERKHDGMLIGSISLSRKEGTAALNLGYNLRQDAWGQGFATEAARALLQAARQIGHHDFIACHAIANAASGKVLARCGFRYDHDGEYAKYDGSETFPARFYTLRLPVAHPFPPVVDGSCRTLILGSFPSVRSREEGFFYGHPQNRFWRVLAGVWQEPVPQSIPEKKAFLLRHRLALWDVIASCTITGSSDASVKDAVPVEIRHVTDAAPIARVLCNGALAGKLYRRHLLPVTGLEALVLPSTSPANAAWSPDRLTEAWRQALLADQPDP